MVATLFHMLMVFDAKVLSDPIIATTMSAKISAYSTAVAPLLSRKIAHRIFAMICSRSSVPWSGAMS